MGLRFQKRIKLCKGLGLNIGKTGVSPSFRNKRGSISKKGYSLRTGIPGLTYRKNFSKSRSSGCLVLFIVICMICTTPISCSEAGTACPTTANCGCSNKTKSDCENDSCCRWIVGEGCKCS